MKIVIWLSLMILLHASLLFLYTIQLVVQSTISTSFVCRFTIRVLLSAFERKTISPLASIQDERKQAILFPDILQSLLQIRK